MISPLSPTRVAILAQEMAFTVTVKPRSSKPSKRFPLTVELSASKPTVKDLKQAIAAKANVCSLSTLGKEHRLTRSPRRGSSM